jgi:hypothetical protein
MSDAQPMSAAGQQNAKGGCEASSVRKIDYEWYDVVVPADLSGFCDVKE